MIKESKKGSALITVTIIFAFLIILGLSLLFVSSADAAQAIHQGKYVQAYQVARSGVEIAMKRINDRIQEKKSGTTPVYYTDLHTLITQNSDVFTQFSGNAGSNTFNVTFDNTSLVNNQMVKIVSTGTVDNVSNSTALTLKIENIGTNLFFLNPKDWINSGYNIHSGTDHSYNGAVIFHIGKTLPHGYIKDAKDSDTIFTASSLYFLDTSRNGHSLELLKNQKSFTLVSDLIVFNSTVVFQDTSDIKFYLKVYSDNGLKKLDGTSLNPADQVAVDCAGWGVIVFRQGVKKDGTNQYVQYYDSIAKGVQDLDGGEDGYYFFNEDPTSTGGTFNIDDPAERIPTDPDNPTKYLPPFKLIRITDPVTKQAIEEIIGQETALGINIKSSIWSKN